MSGEQFIERDRGEDGRHGTTSGAARHAAAGELPCDACRAAKAEYDRRWRSSDEKTRKNRLHAKAQSLAERDLRQAHYEEYRAYYVAHRDRLLREQEGATS